MRRGERARVSSRRAIAWAAGAFALAQVALTADLERPASVRRDPEYAVRRDRFATRQRTHPGREAVAVLGSSRVAMGVRPPEPASGEPLLVNFGHVGAGPLAQRLALLRLLRDGPTPNAIVVEFWPPYVLDTPLEEEPARVLPSRLGRADLPVYGSRFDGEWLAARLVPWYGHRFLLMSQWQPVWLDAANRHEHAWTRVDPSGWTLGDPPDQSRRVERLAMAHAHFAPRLRVAAIRPSSAAAFDALFADCRAAGILATLAWLPESTEMRGWYPPATEAVSKSYVAALAARHGIPFLDARAWADDRDLVDGYHLSPAGASSFTRRLLAAIQDASRMPR